MSFVTSALTTEGEGLANGDVSVNFASKMTNFAVVGEGGCKIGKVLWTSFMHGPFVFNY